MYQEFLMGSSDVESVSILRPEREEGCCGSWAVEVTDVVWARSKSKLFWLDERWLGL
jgi:hypothetical protein